MSAAASMREAIAARQHEIKLRIEDVVHLGAGDFAGEAEFAFGGASGRAWFHIFATGRLAVTLRVASLRQPPTEVVLDEHDGDRLDGLRERLAEALTAGSGAAAGADRGTEPPEAG